MLNTQPDAHYLAMHATLSIQDVQVAVAEQFSFICLFYNTHMSGIKLDVVALCETVRSRLQLTVCVIIY
jgi:hypothetical protein